MKIEEYKKQFDEEEAVGWKFIDKALVEIYGKQEPKHFAPVPHYMLGGDDPIDGISVYDSDKESKHFHFVTYGFSELYYDEESVGEEYSGFGFELTFRLLKENNDDNIMWVCNMLQNLARYVFDTGNVFDEGHFIPANGPIKLDSDTEITAIAFVLDPELGEIDTPHGKVKFLQMVGLTENEYQELKENPLTTETEKLIEKLRKNNELLITDLKRK